jgi:ectoine hydroxylase-related dioxygenase (phytanoyl-CoA dioxygenase family)
MGTELTQAQVNEFFDIGYIAIPNLFSPDEIQEISECMDRLLEMAKDIHTTTVRRGTQFVVEGKCVVQIVWCGGAEPRLLDFASEKKLLLPVAQLLGSRTMEQLICHMHPKIPGDMMTFDWHQDSQFRGYGTDVWKDLNGRGSYVQTLTAIDEVSLNNGPVFFIPRSGHQGHLFLDRLQNPGSAVEAGKAIPMLMRPGTTVFFSPYVVHGSYPNNSSGRRRVFINGYAYPGANSDEYPGVGSGRTLAAY